LKLSKERVVPGLGKLIRLGRIVDPASGTAIVLPLDHPVESAGLVELEQPREIVRCLAGSGINAFLMRRGLARHTVRDFAGQAGWIQRMTGRSGLSTAGDAHRDAHQLVIASVEDAARNGADAVAPTFFFGRDTEDYAYPELGRIADECSRYDIPLLAELFPVGGPDATPYDGPYTVEDMRLAVRIASEEGADLIKTYYTGDPDSFAEVIRYSFVPVIIAGGPKTDDPMDVLRMARGAMDAGASGVAFGRKVWGSSDPAAVVRALIRVVREQAAVEDAAEALIAQDGRIAATLR
jgi:fructose-bisphosphate aldolase/2-amino-3,7-dideoxy-D-threo-hept-6-ulosonate synthase